RLLARRLRAWFLCIPAATGMATAKACLRLLVGISPDRSGVPSAGNGPLMRSLVLGALSTSDDQLKDFVTRSTLITHTDPRALHAALAIALAARAASTPTPADILSAQLPLFLPDGPVLHAAQSAIAAARANTSPADFAASISCPRAISGYVLHTLPAVLFFWLSSPLNPRAAIESAVRRGGDTDTVAALVGGLAAISAGPQSLPQDWIDGIADFPCSVAWVRRLSESTPPPSSLRWSLLPLRNAFFLLVVLTHAARRLFPPYG
ncbi:MAG: ADP-ribosylglycohydrolase family protein, partial [Phycisphaerales bacterium]